MSVTPRGASSLVSESPELVHSRSAFLISAAFQVGQNWEKKDLHGDESTRLHKTSFCCDSCPSRPFFIIGQAPEKCQGIVCRRKRKTCHA